MTVHSWRKLPRSFQPAGERSTADFARLASCELLFSHIDERNEAITSVFSAENDSKEATPQSFGLLERVDLMFFLDQPPPGWAAPDLDSIQMRMQPEIADDVLAGMSAGLSSAFTGLRLMGQ